MLVEARDSVDQLLEHFLSEIYAVCRSVKESSSQRVGEPAYNGPLLGNLEEGAWQTRALVLALLLVIEQRCGAGQVLGPDLAIV